MLNQFIASSRSALLASTLLLFIGAGFMSACNSAPQSSDSSATSSSKADKDTAGAPDKLKIVATTNYVADVVEAVVGDHAEIILLMGPGTDPHLYKPSAADVPLLRSADAIFYNGLLLEGKLDSILKEMDKNGAAVIALGDSADKSRLIQPESFDDYPDPHIWNDPDLWSQTPGLVAEIIGEIQPPIAAECRERATAYSTTIKETGQWARSKIEELPKEKRVLITSHDAFNYLGRSFEIEVYAPQGISTTSQAGLADIAETVKLIKERGIKAIFVESSVSPQVIERIAEQSGAQVGGELFSDAMGAPGETRTIGSETFDVGTYEGVLRYNITTIVEALK